MENQQKISPSEFRKRSFLDDLRNVGQEKPLGYLPIETIHMCRVTPEQMREELEERKLKVIRLESEESRVWSGALYAYDEDALGKLLQDNQTTLLSAGWPTEPEPFVRHLKVHAQDKTSLFDLIADAFGDKTNPGRKTFPLDDKNLHKTP